jgi:hypothetical protein
MNTTEITILSGIIYRQLSALYQQDGLTLPCKTRESVKDAIIKEIKEQFPSIPLTFGDETSKEIVHLIGIEVKKYPVIYESSYEASTNIFKNLNENGYFVNHSPNRTADEAFIDWHKKEFGGNFENAVQRLKDAHKCIKGKNVTYRAFTAGACSLFELTDSEIDAYFSSPDFFVRDLEHRNNLIAGAINYRKLIRNKINL